MLDTRSQLSQLHKTSIFTDLGRWIWAFYVHQAFSRQIVRAIRTGTVWRGRRPCWFRCRALLREHFSGRSDNPDIINGNVVLGVARGSSENDELQQENKMLFSPCNDALARRDSRKIKLIILPQSLS